jgi:C4-dicarboxylate-specific signal transduction histidine kinase
LGVAREQAELFAQMPQPPAQLSEVNQQVLNAKVQKRTMKLAQVNHALQAEIRVRQRAKAGSGN